MTKYTRNADGGTVPVPGTTWSNQGAVPTPKSYVAEVTTGGEFAGNALRFPTKEGAEEYAVDLMRRWTLVQAWRVVGSQDEPNHGEAFEPRPDRVSL